MPNRSQIPPFKEPTSFEFNLLPYKLITLDNKTNVYLVEGGIQKIISCEIVFEIETIVGKQILLPKITNSLLLNGTKNYTAYQISQIFENQGIFVSTTHNRQRSALIIQCLSKNFNKILPIIKEILEESIFPENEIELYKKNEISHLAVQLKKCGVLANRKVGNILYGSNHPLGQFSTAALIENIDRESILSYFEKKYTQGNCTIFLAGNIEIDTIACINKYIGQIAFLHQKIEPIHADLKPFKKIIEHNIENTEGVQAAVRVARPFIAYNHPDFHYTNVLNVILGGYFGSRLMKNIREDKGYTYGIQSYIQHIHLQPSLVISAEVGKQFIDDTIAQIKLEFNKLQQNLISSDELSTVKNFILGSLLNDLNGPMQIAHIWKGYILNHISVDNLYKSIQIIKNIQPQQIQEMAQKYLCIDDFYELSVV